MEITSDIRYVGVDDYAIDLFEGMYAVPRGMSYNSYVILDDKVAILDTVDMGFTAQWLTAIRQELGDRTPDYLIIQHMEPDHSANVVSLLEQYPETLLVASARAFEMMRNYFGTDYADRRIVVGEGDMLSLGRHRLKFVTAPMVHWPEVIMTYDSTDQVLFSADAFGKFGALDVQDDWIDEARRYYFGIVGKYGAQVQSLLRKVADWEIRQICPLHGPVIREQVTDYIRAYDTWSRYEPEEQGVLIAYTSVYGNTGKAVSALEKMLRRLDCGNVVVRDLARSDMSEVVAQAFRYDRMVLATTTYNGEIFPPMREFLYSLVERGYRKRMVALMENGSWAATAARIMRERLGQCQDIVFAEHTVHILSVPQEESMDQLELLAQELTEKRE